MINIEILGRRSVLILLKGVEGNMEEMERMRDLNEDVIHLCNSLLSLPEVIRAIALAAVEGFPLVLIAISVV